MRAHILAIAVIFVVVIVSFAAGRALTAHFLLPSAFEANATVGAPFVP